MSSEDSAQKPIADGSRQSRDASVLIFGRVLATLSDALLPLVIVRLLGKAEVGVLGGVLLLYQTVALVLATGFPPALMYQLPGRSGAERRAIASHMARSMLGFGALASLLLALSGALGELAPDSTASWLGSDTPLAQGALAHLFLLAAFPLGDLPARMLPNLLVIEGRADAAARFAVLRSVGNAVFVLVPASLGFGIDAVLLSYSAFGVLQGVWLWRWLRRLYAAEARIVSPITFRETLRFALPLGATDIVSQLNQRVDRYLIAASFPALMFAEYHVGAFQIPILTTIAYSVGTAYTPMFTELMRAGKARQAIEVWRGTIAKTSLIVVPLSAVFVICAEAVVELLFTKDYTRAAGVFRFYALATGGRVAAFGALIIAAGQPRLILRAAVVTLLLTATLSSLGLWAFGFVGPAIGACVAFVPTVIAYCYYIASATGLRTREIFPGAAYFKVVALAAVAAVPALAFQHFVASSALVTVLGVTVIELGVFTLLGRVTRLITAEDLAFVRGRLRLRHHRSA